MFGDPKLNTSRINEKEMIFRAWLDSLPADSRLVIFEVGAGRTIPRIRDEAEEAMRSCPSASLVRVNLEDPEIGSAFEGRAVSIGGIGASDALTLIDGLL